VQRFVEVLRLLAERLERPEIEDAVRLRERAPAAGAAERFSLSRERARTIRARDEIEDGRRDQMAPSDLAIITCTT
jgi:hypothetical protein